MSPLRQLFNGLFGHGLTDESPNEASPPSQRRLTPEEQEIQLKNTLAAVRALKQSQGHYGLRYIPHDYPADRSLLEHYSWDRVWN